MSTFARRRCRSWRGAGEPTADTLPFLKDRARNDENEDVRQAAVQELRGAGEPTPTPSPSCSWRTDPETLAFLEVKE